MHAALQTLILEKIARGDALADTFRVMCGAAERLSPGTICSVLAVDREGLMRPLAAPGLPPSISAAIEGLPIGPNMGSCGTAAYRREPVLVSDIATDPLWADFKHLFLPFGLSACWSTPIFDSRGLVVGTFAFYFTETRGPNDDDREVVAICTRLCAIALERAAREREAERLAFADSLTGLANRAGFEAAFDRHNFAETGGTALLVIDIDDLKIVNDTFGSRVGDRLLSTIAHRIAEAARPFVAYRVGGDEFAILVTGKNAAAAAEALAENLIAAITKVATCQGHRLASSATIGLAVRDESDIGGELLRQNAYLALYEAKAQARGGVFCYQPEHRGRIASRLRTIGRLHKALGESRVEAAYQPIVDLATGRITGAEALCRVREPDGTMQSAGQFQDALADGRVAAAVTARMIDMIANDLARWRQQGVAPDHIGINLSIADFVDGCIAARMAAAFGGGAKPLAGVTIEITETVYLGRLDAGLLDQIEALRTLGAGIALDDFGTGFASLTHLISMPIDLVKIDKSFVDRLGVGEPGAAIVEGLVRITGQLGIGVIAEGVETAAQRCALIRLGCRAAQGYLYAPALDAMAFTQLLANGAILTASERRAA